MTFGRYSLRSARRWILASWLVFWLAAFVATHVPAERLPETHVSDKKLHAAGFFLLASALEVTLLAHGVRRRWRLITIFLGGAAYAAFDELTQPLVNRTAAWGDWASDLAGLAGAVILWELLLLWRQRRTPATEPAEK